MDICVVEGCDLPRYVKKRALCCGHYKRWWKYGDPLAKTGPQDISERLTSRYAVDVTTGCWVWFGARAGNYGTLRVEGRNIRAHRVAYETWVGSIPEGYVVRHKCDNPPCINPDHLEAGTQSDNIRDKVERRRQARGEGCHKAKLSEHDVVDIRWAHSMGATIPGLAASYGLNYATIRAVVLRLSWAHII